MSGSKEQATSMAMSQTMNSALVTPAEIQWGPARLTKQRDEHLPRNPHNLNGQSEREKKMSSSHEIKRHMEVIGADGVHIGTVERVENGRIRLTKADSGEGRHKGHHHFIDLGLVADVEGQKVRLSANGAVAVTMEEEEDGGHT